MYRRHVGGCCRAGRGRRKQRMLEVASWVEFAVLRPGWPPTKYTLTGYLASPSPCSDAAPCLTLPKCLQILQIVWAPRQPRRTTVSTPSQALFLPQAHRLPIHLGPLTNDVSGTRQPASGDPGQPTCGPPLVLQNLPDS